MGGKTQKQAKRFSAAELAQRAERSLQKLDFKQAHKDAKLCYQQDPTPKHRELLERTWFQRAMALHRAGLGSESRELAQGLLEFGVTQPEVLQGMPELLTAVGLLDRALSGQVGVVIDVRPELLAAAADRAVVSPSTAPKSLREIAPGAARVRAALEALYAGDEAAALDQLKAVPRNSPFADWRLFVRGLAAYYRGDAADAQAHWERIAPGRVPARIAASLLSLSGQGNGAAAPQRTAELERAILGGSLSTYLQEIQANLAEEDHGGAIRVLRRCRPALERIAPEIVNRIERLLIKEFVSKEDEEALEDLCRMTTPPAIDPAWNRTWALFAEHSEDEDGAEWRWRRYLEDLASIPEFTPEERRMAQAMVWERIANLCAQRAKEAAWPWEDEEESRDRDRQQAIQCFHEAIRLFPEFRSAHKSLAAAYLHWGKDAEAAEAHRGLLEHFPDDLESLKFLYQHHSCRQEALVARDYALRAWRLKPANLELITMAWKAHLGAARQFALDGQWDQGRAELAAAERLLGNSPESYYLLASKAMFEFKAGDEAAGKRFLDDACVALDNSPPAYLLLLIEAIRYQLPYKLDGIKGDLERRLQRGLSQKPQGKAAGLLCRILKDIISEKVDYFARPTHLKQVLAYLKRCGKIRWNVGELLDVCRFIQALPVASRTSQWRDLYEKLLCRGMKLFPECADFPILAGCHEIDKGPRLGNPITARRYLERGRDLAKKAGPASATLLETAERSLAFLEDLLESFSPVPFRPDWDGDDEEDDGPESDEEWGGIDPLGLLRGFFETCQKLGLDPSEVLKDIIGGKLGVRSRPKRKNR